MKLKTKIREAKLKDLNYIYSLGKEIKELKFCRKMNFHDKIELREFIKRPKDNILLVAVSEKRVIGFLYAKIISKTWCMLDNLAVDKDYRNKGIGTLLLKEFYKILKKKKIHYLQILEDIHRKKTREFWKKNGFKEEKVFLWADKTL